MAPDPPLKSSMLSGPDLGGGYLHQLTAEAGGATTRFVYHAQDGGSDAGGPPVGPLDALGFLHPEAACPFGGPRCWHREFRAPFEETPRVRAAYNRFRFTLEAMLAQLYQSASVDVSGALTEAVGRIAPSLLAGGIGWFVGGSASGQLLGGDLTPRDIDLGTDRAGVARIGEALGPYLIEPVAETEWGAGHAVHAGRAFVGSLQQGARVEWSVPATDREPFPYEEFSGHTNTARLLPVPWAGATIHVSRPEYGLLRAAERGRSSAVRAWAGVVRRVGPDLELLEVLLARSRLPPARQAELRRGVTDGRS